MQSCTSYKLGNLNRRGIPGRRLYIAFRPFQPSDGYFPTTTEWCIGTARLSIAARPKAAPPEQRSIGIGYVDFRVYRLP